MRVYSSLFATTNTHIIKFLYVEYENFLKLCLKRSITILISLISIQKMIIGFAGSFGLTDRKINQPEPNR